MHYAPLQSPTLIRSTPQQPRKASHLLVVALHADEHSRGIHCRQKGSRRSSIPGRGQSAMQAGMPGGRQALLPKGCAPCKQPLCDDWSRQQPAGKLFPSLLLSPGWLNQGVASVGLHPTRPIPCLALACCLRSFRATLPRYPSLRPSPLPQQLTIFDVAVPARGRVDAQSLRHHTVQLQNEGEQGGRAAC